MAAQLSDTLHVVEMKSEVATTFSSFRFPELSIASEFLSLRLLGSQQSRAQRQTVLSRWRGNIRPFPAQPQLSAKNEDRVGLL
jgi:hypothetical protein